MAIQSLHASGPDRVEKVNLSFRIVDERPAVFQKLIPEHTVRLGFKGPVEIVQAGQQRVHLFRILITTGHIAEYSGQHFDFFFPDTDQIDTLEDGEMVEHPSVDVPVDQVKFSTRIQDHFHFDPVDQGFDQDQVFPQHERQAVCRPFPFRFGLHEVATRIGSEQDDPALREVNEKFKVTKYTIPQDTREADILFGLDVAKIDDMRVEMGEHEAFHPQTVGILPDDGLHHACISGRDDLRACRIRSVMLFIDDQSLAPGVDDE